MPRNARIRPRRAAVAGGKVVRMGVNPNQPEPRQPRPGPQETGHRLATFPRRWNGEELRVTLAEYQGNAYIALRVWARGSDGQLWPVKGKGVSVRIAEVADLADVLAEVAEQLDAGELPDPDPAPGAIRSHQGHGPAAPTGRPPGQPFDEFGGGSF